MQITRTICWFVGVGLRQKSDFLRKHFKQSEPFQKLNICFFAPFIFFVVLCRMLVFPLEFFIFHSLGYRILKLFVRYTFCCRLMLLLNTKWTRTCWSKKIIIIKNHIEAPILQSTKRYVNEHSDVYATTRLFNVHGMNRNNNENR